MLRKKKKYRVKKGRILIVLVLLILVFAAGLFTFLKLNQDSYFSANGFEKYGNSFSKEIGGQKQIGEEKLQIDYGEPLSTYISRPDMKHSLPNDTIIKEINSLKKNFELKYGKGSGYNKTALLIDYESYKTPEYVRSVGIHVKTRLENEEKDKINTSHYIKTYNFSNVSGYPISSRDIFTGDYITVYKKNVSQQLKKEYGQELLDNYEKKHLESMGEFLMTDKGFKFFFEEGTVLPKEKDLISVEIPYSTFKGFMKKDVGKNVIFPDKPMVALTYDDGPKEGLSSQLLDIFEKNNAVCTFFELGSQVNSVKDSSQIMKRALSLGCEEGLHSYSHPNLPTISPYKLKEEVDKSYKAFDKAIGQKPTIFRPPYGNSNDKIAKAFNLPSINWNVDTLDWKYKNADRIVKHVQGLGNLDGDIVLMHSIYPSSIEASKILVPWLKDQGYQLVTVSELLQYKYNETPKNGKDYGYNFRDLKN